MTARTVPRDVVFQFTAEELVPMLARPGYRPAVQPLAVLCPVYGVRASTVCNWATRGLIKRYPGGYDMLEIELRLLTRDTRKGRVAS